MDSTAGTLSGVLKDALPEGLHCKFRYIHTPPRLCDALFTPPAAHDPEKTRLASHFLAVSASSSRDSGEIGQDKDDVLVLAIEVLVYTTKHLTTIFVSKADSTGYLKPQKPSPVRTIATTFLHWLVSQQLKRHASRQVVVSLFARAQAQYLFPGSAENGKKHVLDDRQLIRWWARVLDPILTQGCGTLSDDTKDSELQAWMTVPGYEGSELRQFFPKNLSSAHHQFWKAGNPLGMLAETREVSKDAAPRSLLPRFPDDPKARFMQDLDDEVGLASDSTTVSPSKRKHGNWKNISNLDRFWEAMEFRQECSSGRMVGFLWLVVSPKESNVVNGENISSQDTSVSAPNSQSSSDPVLPSSDITSHPNGSPTKRKRKPLTGPIITRQPRLKGGSSSSNATSSGLNGMLNSVRGDGLILSKEAYDQAMQTLLHLDFGTAEVATRSTARWVDEVRSTCGLSGDWAVSVSGVVEPAIVPHNGAVGGVGGGQVNDLSGGMMVRKKRKAGDDAVTEGRAVADSTVQTAGEEKPAVNVLGAGMVRKKAKPAAAT